MSATSSTDVHWTVAHPGLLVRRLDEDFAVFDPATSYTHVLSAAAGPVLLELMRAPEPLAVEQLVTMLPQTSPDPDYVTEVLQHLRDAGLAQAVEA